MEAIIEAVRTAGYPFGLNLVAALPVERYLAESKTVKLPDTDVEVRSIIVVANGGSDFWRSFVSYRDAQPGWEERANPLDDFTRKIVDQTVAGCLRDSGIGCTAVYPFDPAPFTLDFMALGKASGLAGPSLLGVVINPIYGPWIAFRAALLVDLDLDAPGDARGFDPCPGCMARTCIPACPVGAIDSPLGWDLPRCLKYRIENEAVCNSRCHARTACVIGPEHRYPDQALAYHHMRALRAMRPYYGSSYKN
jgi:hypothetical protein